MRDIIVFIVKEKIKNNNNNLNFLIYISWVLKMMGLIPARFHRDLEIIIELYVGTKKNGNCRVYIIFGHLQELYEQIISNPKQNRHNIKIKWNYYNLTMIIN